MAKGSKVYHEDGAVHFSIDHPVLRAADPEIVAGCLDALLDCAAQHGCLDGRVQLNEHCFETVARHNRESGCLTSCFGCG